MTSTPLPRTAAELKAGQRLTCHVVRLGVPVTAVANVNRSATGSLRVHVSLYTSTTNEFLGRSILGAEQFARLYLGA